MSRPRRLDNLYHQFLKGTALESYMTPLLAAELLRLHGFITIDTDGYRETEKMHKLTDFADSIRAVLSLELEAILNNGVNHDT